MWIGDLTGWKKTGKGEEESGEGWWLKTWRKREKMAARWRRMGMKCCEGGQLTIWGEEDRKWRRRGQRRSEQTAGALVMMDNTKDMSRDGCWAVGFMLFSDGVYSHAVCQWTERIVGKDFGSVSGVRGSQCFVCVWAVYRLKYYQEKWKLTLVFFFSLSLKNYQ